MQGFDIWFGGVGADRRRRAKEHQTPVQRKTAENPRPIRAGRKGGKARRALKKIIPALTGFELDILHALKDVEDVKAIRITPKIPTCSFPCGFQDIFPVFC
ncbi:hypothetical protein BMT91_26290, partial [Escherichia coli]